MKKLPEQRNLNNAYLRGRDKSTNNNKDNNVISMKTKEDISKTASILEERVFGKDLKNVNILPNNPLGVKNITFRNDKEKDKIKENTTQSINNYFNYNLLKRKEEEAVANRPELKQIKNLNRTQSLNDLTFRNDENSPCFINEINITSKNIPMKANVGLVKIGDVYHRQNIPKNEEKISNGYAEDSKNDSNYPLEKCEIEMRNNPLYVVEYSREIFDHLKKTENINSACHGYFNNGFQKNINDKMRTILVDWIIDVHNKFKLVPETLYLTINIIDSYLGKAPIENSKFQLLGVSAMLLAAKYEEIYAPEVRDFVYITDKCCSKEEIIAMESKILTVLDFELLWTSPLRFLERYHFISSSNSNLNSKDISSKCFYLAQYILEISLLEYKLLVYPPSLKAASSLYISRKILKIDGPSSWTNSLQFHTDYKEKELINCAKDMCSMLELIPNLSLKACYKKFSTPKFFEVSSFVSQKFNDNKQEKNKK